VVLDLRGISSFTDFFVICSATSEPHLKAINSGIREGIREHSRISPLASEGSIASQWLVMDYSDVLVHIFLQKKREFYALESLWSDAPRLDLVS
jgi:ribosome-associated protein